MRVAVTGVGGGVGQSIMKALTLSTLPVEVVPIDVQALSAGLYRGHHSVVLPRLETPGSPAVWAKWLTDQGVTALIPGSDHDLVPMATIREAWMADKVCQVLVSDLPLVQACRDKAMTYRRLKAEGIDFAESVWDCSIAEALEWANGNGYPVVLKPRDGFGSRHVRVIADEEELRFFFGRTERPIVQEYLTLAGGDEEYTCAVFVDSAGVPAGTFMARRDLSGGATYRAEIGHWPALHELLLRIGRALRPRGPLNVQLRRTSRGFVPFEINIRCSGTSAIRAYYGYNEPEMLLRHYVLAEPLPPVVSRRGYALRYWNEVFLDDVDAASLRAEVTPRKGTVLPWP